MDYRLIYLWNYIFFGTITVILRTTFVVASLSDECRKPFKPPTNVPKTPGDNGFRLRISQNKDTYIPGHNYTSK